MSASRLEVIIVSRGTGGLGPADLYKYTKAGVSKMSTATLARVAEGNGFKLVIEIRRKKPAAVQGSLTA